MSPRAEEYLKTVAQVVAILMLAGIVAMVLHKGYVDISGIARAQHGEDFWKALLRYFFRNLAG